MSQPRVSAVIAAYNMAEYLGQAIDSVLQQRGFDGDVEVIVVDDGSTDSTPELLAGYGDAIRVISQVNAGQEESVRRACMAATGEYVALLDADDVWTPGRLASHVAILESRRAVGLVYGDAEVIDKHGVVTERSYFETRRIEATEGRILGRLIRMNFIGTSGITFRASHRPAIYPGIGHSAYTDWGVVASIAAVATIARAPGVSYQYRLHEDNRLFGTEQTEHARNQARCLPWYQWMLVNLINDQTISLKDIATMFARLMDALRVAASGDLRADPRALMEADRASAEQAFAEAPAPAAGALRSRALLRALAFDPFNGAIAIALQNAMIAESNMPAISVSAPVTDVQARADVKLARLEQILRAPDALRAYAAAQDRESETLVILAPRGGDLQQLVSLIESDAQLSGEGLHAVLIDEPVTAPAWAWLEARSSGWMQTG